VDMGLAASRPGGPFSDVHWAIPLLFTVGYLCLVFFGVRIMEYRPPVRSGVFEWMVVYNAAQALLNLGLTFSLLMEVWKLGYRWPWGNELDSSQNGHRLGSLIWLHYHCRHLDLLDTLFMILRKKFQRISFVHVYLRLLNLWAWYVACRFACGGDTYFAALVNAACQVIVYAYYVIYLCVQSGVPFFRRARVAEIQVFQFVICGLHALFVLWYGNVPRSIAAFNLFIMGNCLMFYIDFDSEHPRLGPPKTLSMNGQSFGHGRLTFCFDSCGWLYVYHFGVAKWIEDHMIPEGITTDNAASDKYPEGLAFSGSSGGSLVAGALGSGISVRDLFEYVLEQREPCKMWPWGMFPALEGALDKFLPKNCAKSLTGRVRVLLTRISLKAPFLTGEIVDRFEDWDEAKKTLRASCHIPFMHLKPYEVSKGRWYFDGFLWSSLFVPWVSDDSHVVKVSALSRPLTDIRARLQPLWWSVFPPQVDVLRGMFWSGYRDASRFFTETPKGPIDLCKCRRPEDLKPEDLRMLKYQAAQKLLIKAPGTAGRRSPLIDERTGQNVEELVRAYERSIQWNLAVLAFFWASATVGLVAVVLSRWIW